MTAAQWIVVALLGATIFGGCMQADNSAEDRPRAFDGDVNARLLDSNYTYSDMEHLTDWTRPSARWFLDEAAWAAQWPNETEPPVVDFARQAVLAIEWGPHPSTHYSMTAGNVSYRNATGYRASAHLTKPGNYCAVGTAVTYTYAWFAVDRVGDLEADTPVQIDHTEAPGESCAEFERPFRKYAVLTVFGNVSQQPAHQGQQAVCGRPVGAASGLLRDEKRLVVVDDRHDFDWEQSWIVVAEDVETHDDALACHHRRMRAEETPTNWTYRGLTWPIRIGGHGEISVGDLLIPPNESQTANIDLTEGDRRYVGSVTFTHLSGWNVQDIRQVRNEGEVTGWTAYWGGTTRP